MGVYDRYMEGPRRSPSELIFGPIKVFFKWVFFFAGIFLLFGIILVSTSSTLNAQKTGVLNVIYTETDVALSNIPLLKIVYNGAKDLLKFQKDPSLLIRDYGWKTNVDDNKDNQNLGLKFVSSFIPEKQNYKVDEQISASSTVEISSLKDDSIVEFSCSSKDLSEDEQIIVKPSEPQKILKNQLRRFPVACEVPANTLEIPEGKQVYPIIIKIHASYDFKTISYVDTYTMQISYLKNLLNNKEDPFENLNNKNFDKTTRQARSETTRGPMLFILSLQYDQPLTEQGPFTEDNAYSLGLKIEKSGYEWEGKLKEINKVYIKLPISFELVDDNFEEVNIDDDEQEIYPFRKYRLKQTFIDELNKQCETYKLDTEKCNELFERGFIITITKFRVNDVEPRRIDDSISAEIEYKFETSKTTTVTLVKSFI